MKSTIGRKIFIVIFIPLLIIFGALSLYIAYMMTQYFTNWTELELKGISDINAARIEGKINSVRISVLSAADILEKIDADAPDARELADECVRAMFINDSVYNAWLVFEPEAFDGKDAEHTMDYPGAPSGRLMRSYVVKDGQIIVAPDMDEETIDDPVLAPWYVIPRDVDRLYIDVITSGSQNLYDYGVGGDPAYTLSIVVPVRRDGQVIGCVGADVDFDTMTFGIGNAKNASVAVFYPDGRVFFAEDIAFAEDSIDTLNFTDTASIKRAMDTKSSIFLPDEYCPFIGKNAFTYFHPVRGGDENDTNLFLYVALPRDEMLGELRPMLFLAAAIVLTALLALLIMIIYVIGRISRPIRELTLAADAISQGDIETEIATFSDMKGEIGLLSRSLHRMVEQFRVYIIQLEQTQSEMSVHMQIEEIIRTPEGWEQVLSDLSAMLCGHFGIYKASVITINSGRPCITSFFVNGDSSEKPGGDFLYHSRVVEMIAGRQMLFLNSFAIAEHNVEFIDAETVSACVVPLRSSEILYGYIILENRDKDNSFSFGSESLLIYMAGELAEWLAQKDADTGEEPEMSFPDESDELDAEHEPEDIEAELVEHVENTADTNPLTALSKVGGLEVYSAIEVMGGLEEVYLRSITLLARLMPEMVEKLDECLAGDTSAFAIEIHGMKGSLNNVGAYKLGKAASHIEKAAKAGDRDSCTENYPPFKESLMRFHRELQAVLEDGSDKEPGSAKALARVLDGAAEAIGSYNALDALDVLRPFLDLSYGKGIDTLLEETVRELEIFECEKAFVALNSLREKLKNTGVL